jgi:hypothetical protein
MCRVYEIGMNQVDKGRSFPTEIGTELPAGIADFDYSLFIRESMKRIVFLPRMFA